MLEKLNAIKLFLASRLRREGKIYAFLRVIYKKLFVWQAKRLAQSPERLEQALRNDHIEKITQHPSSSGFIVELKGRKLWWRDPSDSNHLLSIIIFSHQGIFEEEETNMFKKLIGPRDVVFDVGANLGWHSLTFAELASEGQVVCFEPDEKTFQELNENINLNYPSPHQNIVLEKYALGDEKKEVLLYLPQQLGAAFASVMPNYYQKISGKVVVEKIQMIRLDDYCEEKNISRVDFIKCDVEGAPHLVVKGAKNLLSPDEAPLLFIEITKRNPDEFNTFHLLRDFGYQAFVLRRGGLVSINPEEIKAQSAEYNFLFAKNNHLQKISPLIK
ncbi:MAG: FkbM family methyltransferase [Anaplasmataceae bacterium]|nr:FkbM family methyltransferase [Anaplasmataceae bacterium]